MCNLCKLLVQTCFLLFREEIIAFLIWLHYSDTSTIQKTLLGRKSIKAKLPSASLTNLCAGCDQPTPPGLVFHSYSPGNKDEKNTSLQKDFDFPWHPAGGFPGGSDMKESAYNARDLGSIPGSGRSPEGNGNPLQYSCLEYPMDKGACGLEPMGPERVRHDWMTNTFFLHFSG